MSDFSDISKYPEYFYKLVNIEDNPDFLPVAEELAVYFFNQVNYAAADTKDDSGNVKKGNYRKFFDDDPKDHPKDFDDLTKRFDERITKIYKDFEVEMFKPEFFDSGLIDWNKVVVNQDAAGNLEYATKSYDVGRFSNQAIKERLMQASPYNLLDGVWLQNILKAGPTDEVRSRLFSIWSDEAGNGETELNHANVYDTLLKSLDIYLPSITSREFSEYPAFLKEAFINPIFQLSVGMFPERFFPELLGMTLYLEWEATPTLYQRAKCYERRGIDAQFYSLHVAIDNVIRGHGALAKEAILFYLADKQEEGGFSPVKESFERIWKGYVTWATLSDFGTKLLERMLLVDKKQINIDLRDPAKPVCFPNYKIDAYDRMIALVSRRSDIAKEVHKAKSVGGQSLSALFDTPSKLLEGLQSAGYVNPEHPRDSRFLKLLEFDGPMYKVFTSEDIDIIRDWIESLRESFSKCVNPLPAQSTDPQDWNVRMRDLLASNSSVGSSSHRGISLPLEDGTTKTINELFGDIPTLMKAMVRGGWITPGSLDDSVFYTRLIGGEEKIGPMAFICKTDEDLEIVKEWIKGGAKPPTIISPLAAPLSLVSTSDDLEQAVTTNDVPLTFAKRRQLIGMGSVH
jgi:hypothetical protein